LGLKTIAAGLESTAGLRTGMLYIVSSGLRSVRVRAWSNGQPRATGAAYGIRLPASDRDRVFDPGWTEVAIALDGNDLARMPLSGSFWRSCPELRSADIGR
jgi:hypothetical protein